MTLSDDMMLRDETTSETFSAFFEEHEARLRHVLTACFGSEVGKEAASWTSVDGITWTQFRDDQATLGSEGQRMYSVTESASGLVAVGAVGLDVRGSSGDAAVWLWND